MGFWDTLTDLFEAATPWATAEAEAPAKEVTVCFCFLCPSIRHQAGLYAASGCEKELCGWVSLVDWMRQS